MDHWGHDPWADADEPAAASPPRSHASKPVATVAPAVAASTSPWATASSVGRLVADPDALWTSPWGASNDGYDVAPDGLKSTATQPDNDGWGSADQFTAPVASADSPGAEKPGGGWSRPSSDNGEAAPSRRDSLQSDAHPHESKKTPHWDEPKSDAVPAGRLDGAVEDNRADQAAQEEPEESSDDDEDDAFPIRKPRPIEFLDLSLIDDLLSPRPAPDEAPNKLPSRGASLLSSVGAKRAWHKLSRRETLRAVNSGQEDDAYVRVSWKVSRVRADVTGIVSGWQPQNLAFAGGGAAGREDVFRWDSRASESGAAARSPVGLAVPPGSGADGRAKEVPEEEPVRFNWSSVAADTGNWDTPKDEAEKPVEAVQTETKTEDAGISLPEIPEEAKPHPLLLKPSSKPEDRVNVRSDLPLTPKSTENDDDWGDMVGSSREVAIDSPPTTSSPSPSLTKRSPAFSDPEISTDHSQPDDAPLTDDGGKATASAPPFDTRRPPPSRGAAVDPRAQRAAASSHGPEMPAPFFSDLQPKAAAVRSYLIRKAADSQRGAPPSPPTTTSPVVEERVPARSLHGDGAPLDSSDEESPLATSEAWHAHDGAAAEAAAVAGKTVPGDGLRLGDGLALPEAKEQVQVVQGLHEDAKRIIDRLGSFAYMLK